MQCKSKQPFHLNVRLCVRYVLIFFLFIPLLFGLTDWLADGRATEISLGKVLGRGGFCVVHEIAKISLLHEKNSTDDPQLLPKLFADDEHAIHNIVQNRPFMEAHCLRGKGKDCRYALKRLQESCLENAQTYINGVVDLAIEARFLSVVRHPNIIKMRAMALTSPFSLDEPFFVILDRLYDSKCVDSTKIPVRSFL